MRSLQRLPNRALSALLLGLTLTLSGCFDIFKRDAPAPQIAGTYNVTSFRLTVGNQSRNGSSGTVEVTGPANDKIDLSINLTGLGPIDLEGVEVRKNGRRDYDIMDGGDKIGSVNGTDFNFDLQGTDDDGQNIRLRISARK